MRRVVDPKLSALELIQDLGINTLPINPFEVCKALRIDVFEREFDGIEGILLFSPKLVAIGLNSLITYEPRRNFSISHELGHYCMDVELGKVQNFACTKEMIGGSASKLEIELRADAFASSFLMPDFLLNKCFYKEDPSWDLVKQIANLCNVSLISSVKKYINSTSHVCCLVVSNKLGIRYYKSSKNFRYGLQMDSKVLSDGTVAKSIFNGEVHSAKFEYVPADLWLTGYKINKDSEILEHSLPLNQYGDVLTLLWDDGSIDDALEDDVQTYLKDDGPNYSFGGVDNFPWEPPTFHKSKKK